MYVIIKKINYLYPINYSSWQVIHNNEKSENQQILEKIESEVTGTLQALMSFSHGKKDFLSSKRLQSSFSFKRDRFCNQSEIAIFCAKLNEQSEQFKFFDPQSLPTSDGVHDKTSKDNLIKKLNTFNHDVFDEYKIYGNFVPLLFQNNYWVLFGVFSKGKEKTAVLFDSYDYLKENEINEIKKLSNQLGAELDRHSHINKNLQKNARNACAIFVQKAMELIVENSNIEPNITLSGFAENFLKTPKEHQKMFNKTRRAFFYDNLLNLAKSFQIQNNCNQ